jgi:hypothetical protein
VKQSDAISVDALIKDRKWKEDLIPLYLGSGKEFSKSYIINIENYLTRIGVEWRVK